MATEFPVRTVKYRGAGSYGCVLEDLYAPSNTRAALKLFYGHEESSAKSNAEASARVQGIMNRLDRGHVFSIDQDDSVTMVDRDALEPEDEVALCEPGGSKLPSPRLVTTFMELGSCTMQDLPAETTFRFFVRALTPLFDGLVVLKEHGFPLHDIKGPNILLVGEGFKFMDFDLAGPERFRVAGTKDPLQVYEIWPPESAMTPRVWENRLEGFRDRTTTEVQKRIQLQLGAIVKVALFKGFRGEVMPPKSTADSAVLLLLEEVGRTVWPARVSLSKMARALYTGRATWIDLQTTEAMSAADVFGLGMAIGAATMQFKNKWYLEHPREFAALLRVVATMVALPYTSPIEGLPARLPIEAVRASFQEVLQAVEAVEARGARGAEILSPGE